MNGVPDAVAGAVFACFSDALARVPQSDDPVADFFFTGAMYRDFALACPQRYALMFGTSTPPFVAAHRADLTIASSAISRAEWSAGSAARIGDN